MYLCVPVAVEVFVEILDPLIDIFGLLESHVDSDPVNFADHVFFQFLK